MTASLEKSARKTFAERFGRPPSVVAFAPGRVEILGNHTDYNGGYVLSVALDRGIAVAAALARSVAVTDSEDTKGEDTGRARVWSEAFAEEVEFSLEAPAAAPGSWSNYVRGVAGELRRAGVHVRSLDAVIVSDIPVGAGVSSSAALELATAEAASALAGSPPGDRMALARLCQRAEVSFVGVPCGLLDQFSSAFGRRGCALFLDCDTLAHDRVPLGEKVRIVLADSGVQHELVDGQYAELRRACEGAAARLAGLLARPVRCLRDVTSAELARVVDRLPLAEAARARHVIGENERVLAGVEALRNGDVATLGRLMVASHASSRDLLGNSTAELDFLVESAAGLEGFIGGKLCGGGFGGSTVHLVRAGHEESFAQALGDLYEARYGQRPRTLLTAAGDGSRATLVAGSA